MSMIKEIINNHSVKKREFILSLIKDDLTNTRLVYGLKIPGLDSGKYYLRLSEIIFSIMEITDEDFIDRYIERSRAVVHVDIFEHRGKLDKLASNLYRMLVKKAKEKK